MRRFPSPQSVSATPYVIVARDFVGFDARAQDKLLVDRELTLSVIRDLTCDRAVTYKQIADSCGPDGSTPIYDWRKFVSRYGYPDEGAAIPCFRLVTP